MSSRERVYALHYPSSFRALVDTLAVFNVDLGRWLPYLRLHCMGVQPLWARLSFIALVPVGLAAAPLLLTAARRRPPARPCA